MAELLLDDLRVYILEDQHYAERGSEATGSRSKVSNQAGFRLVPSVTEHAAGADRGLGSKTVGLKRSRTQVSPIVRRCPRPCATRFINVRLSTICYARRMFMRDFSTIPE